ncbi:TPA: hypothetical protein N0F65_001887 [Lagenidium giganteum]|uniref:non-specific serine/threonine protein kinase n=1 Tax=Lagenidium giganteum TaxID=4803 RepID=A0AAV2YXF0_9STRA|nr:TPA: hypothetical protein N0F65_001887 [Lagenidium giganteum]
MATTSTSASAANGAIARIQRLSTDVVNRIAAGEVIHRPSNALKELLENSLDAGSTQITVTVGQGGLALLQIQDNGKGIHKNDLEIVCERFTTSKLKTFEDLRSISSFGFRGEALASISHVAHVTIISKTADQQCAFKGFYRDGKLVPKRPGGSKDPTPCAGKNGTQIIVEDLFYNLSTRKQALKNTSEQYQRILDVVQKYAVHFGARGVGFVCKKHRESSCDLNTMQASNQRDVIRVLFGTKLTNEITEFSASSKQDSTARDLDFNVRGFISNANYNLKKSQFILFINNRLVDCPPLKRACDYVYSLYLPKHTHPFVYISLEMPPQNIDVNVHPTKREVHFLYEEQIVDAISQAIEKQLKGSNESRSFAVQPITSMLSKPLDTDSEIGRQDSSVVGEDSSNEQSAAAAEEESTTMEEDLPAGRSQVVDVDLSQRVTPKSKKYNATLAPQRLVRTDHRSNTIDKYFFLDSQRSQPTPASAQSQHPTSNQKRDNRARSPRSSSEEQDDSSAGGQRRSRLKKRKLSYTEPEPEATANDRRSSLAPTQSPQLLTSVQNLLHAIESRKNKGLERLFREHTFVGMVNAQHALVQYRTKLYLVRVHDVAYQLFYQQVIRGFGELAPIKLKTPLPVYALVYEALNNPRNGYDEEDGPKDQLAREITELLVSNGPMLAEYFSLDIDAEGKLRTLPRLLADHEPSLHSLPEFLSQLATDVNWEEEEPCFDNVAQMLAKWYSELRYPMHDEQYALVLEHVIFPATKQPTAFSPPQELNDSSVLTPVACLTNLYKIFERWNGAIPPPAHMAKPGGMAMGVKNGLMVGGALPHPGGMPHTSLPLPAQAQPPAPAPGAAAPKQNAFVRKMMQQTIGENYEQATIPKLQSFVSSIESYCASTESLASLGKSLYTSTAMVFVVDEMMRIILWNDCAIKLTGYSREEMAGRNLTKDLPYLVPPQTASLLGDALTRCLQGVPVTGVILSFSKRDGTKINVLATCTMLLSNPVGQGMLVLAQDVAPIGLFQKQSMAETPAIADQNTHSVKSTVMAPRAGGSNSNQAVVPASQITPAPTAGPAVSASNATKIPGWSEIAPHYSIECVLGQGSYGQVNVFSDPIDAKRILRELCIVRQLRHPNIVQIREIIAPRDITNFQDLFVVFEYLPSDLEKLLHSPQFLTAEHLRWLLLDLLKALKYMHSAEIVHRDLKPANVLLNLSPVAIKICDFGLARGLSSTRVSAATARKRKRATDGNSADDRTLEGTGVHPRTPGKRIQRQLTEHVVTRWYRAPEIIFRDHDYSAAIDVWSVGCIFAELLSMQKSSVPSHYQREPLFPGVSCFPLSPGAGQTALPQDSRDQLNTILDVLGTMDDEDIEEIADKDVKVYLRSIPKRPRRNLQEMYPGAEPEAIDLLTWMLQMNPRKRATLDEALSHKYLASIRSLEEEIVAPGHIKLDFDEKKLGVTEIRTRMVSEIKFYHPNAGKKVM